MPILGPLILFRAASGHYYRAGLGDHQITSKFDYLDHSRKLLKVFKT